MKTIQSVADWIRYRRNYGGRSAGFVPTMGALHEGHISLVRRSRRENEFTVASIFVNPAQFDRADDLSAYPRQLGRDLELLAGEGVDAVFAPDEQQVYPDGRRYGVHETEFSKILCGAHRPGHFDGVLNVVMRLFNIVRPTRAYFGEKDWQQLQLVRGMVEAFFLDVEIVACPIVREHDGLAMSSRNANLDTGEREQASALYRELSSGREPKESVARLESLGFNVDYFEDHGSRRLAAVFLGKTRLIDNVKRS